MTFVEGLALSLREYYYTTHAIGKERAMWVEYYCYDCESYFELHEWRSEARCPDCLGWDAHPTEDEDEVLVASS